MTPDNYRSFNLPTKESEIGPSTGRPETRPELLRRNIPFEELNTYTILTDCVSATYRESSHYYTYYAPHYLGNVVTYAIGGSPTPWRRPIYYIPKT